VELLKSFSF